MPRLALSKSSLGKAGAQLKTYERFLPSLDLKRKQLIAERAKAIQQLQAGQQRMNELHKRVREELPMLAVPLSGLEGMAQIRQVHVGQENIVGTQLPSLVGVDLEQRSYQLMSKPHWVDSLEALLELALEQSVRLQIQAQRVRLLDDAVRTITQRVNLFEKILIPRTRQQIKKIRIFLADGERAAVVRAKIAKGKQVEGK